MFTMSSILDHNAKHYTNNVAMLFEDGTVETWHRHVEKVARLAAGLKKLGLKGGERIVIISENSVEQATLFHSCYWSGIVPVPLNFRLSKIELERLLAQSSAQFLFVSPTFVDLANSITSVGWQGSIFLLGAGKGSHTGTCELISRNDPCDAVATDRDDVATLLFTGGTTGNGKGVPLTNENVVSNGLQVATALGTSPSEIFLHVAPMFHSADLLGTAVTLGGGAHKYLSEPNPSLLMKSLQETKITMTMAPPVLLRAAVNHFSDVSFDLPYLRIFICGGAPVPYELLKAASETMKHTTMVQGYGMTETSPIISFVNWKYAEKEESSSALMSSGKPLAGVETKLCDMNVDGVGELAVRGPSVFSGYYNETDEVQGLFEDGWFRTGDMASFDKDGYLHIVDRKKDMIITGGENVYSKEVEDVLFQHPEVNEVAVIGLPDEHWGERVVAVIVCEGKVMEDTLHQHCQSYLGKYKIPKEWFFVDEIPKSALGKTLKNKLRELIGV